ncbi:MAG: hypothetical protein ABIJ33_00400 [Patescibacteria group bacterium]
MRNVREIVQDKIMMLFLIALAKEKSQIDGNLKFQKLFFLTEWKLMESNIKAFNFKFFRYRFGPFSKELWCDYNSLKEKKYVNSSFNLSDKAVDLIDYVHNSIQDIENNSEIIGLMSEICDTYSKYGGRALTQKVYNMEIEPYDFPRTKMKIKDIPVFFDILVPENFSADKELRLPDFLIQDLEQEFKGHDLTEEEEGQLMEESRNRLIELILSKGAPLN